MKITIDLDELRQLARNGKDIFLKPDGEQALLRLLEIQDAVNDALEEARRGMEAEALKLNPEFLAIRADHITVLYRPYGARYRLDETQVDQVPAGLLTTRASRSVDGDAVEKYVREYGRLPAGIVEVPRAKQIVISRKEAGDGDA